jgi:predicted deacetylase
MAHGHWTRLEALFDSLGIKPLVAVVPDNQDPVLQIDAPDPGFWERVRVWQAKGWTIALHGYQHVFHAVDRRQLLLPFYDRSEFASLPLAAQAEKLRAAWALCQSHGVTPTVWIAPAHCFDRVTLTALREVTPIRIISDGIARDAYDEAGFFWLPQQLWSLAPRRSGLWTVCLHPNSLREADFDRLAEQLASPGYRERIIAVDQVERTSRRRSLADRVYAGYFWNRGRAIAAAQALRGWARGRAR